jgi:glycosyltransferase involved in cell wall biosynthesis
MILWAERHSAASIAVSQALKDLMVGFGIPGNRIAVLRNGVDVDKFRPGDREAARRRLQVEGPILLSVGHLIERKGHDLVIDALGALPGRTLLVIGDGELEPQLRARARAAGCADRVRFLHAMPQVELVDYYNAADALVLASSREGLPNVVLEAMACGTPVVATCAGGTPEIVREPETGRLLRERTAESLVAAIRDLDAHPPDRDLIRKHAESLAWNETTRGQVALFRRVIEEWPAIAADRAGGRHREGGVI